MGKGSRNRSLRESEPKQEQKKKVRRYRKPLPGALKATIASVVCVLIVAAIVFGVLASNGTLKRSNILVKSKTGDYNVNQQMATYMVWDALYYTASYQWAYLSDSIKTQTGITNQSQYCLYYAMSGVQETLRTSIDSYASTLKEYVAVCDLAESFGVSLSAEEKKKAADDAESNITYMAALSQLNANAFINMYIGCNVKMKDIKDVAVMQALYSKIVDKKQDEVKASITEEILSKYRDENPENFYSTDYITASTEKEDLKNALLAAKDLNGFKTVLVKDVFENGDNNFKALFNKYVTTHADDANKVLSAVEKKTSMEDLNSALTGQELTVAEYLKSDEALNATLSKWMFDSARKQFDAVTVNTADAIYVVVLTAAPADDKVTAAVKTFTLDSGDTYGEDTAFKTNMLNTLLEDLGLLEATEDMKLYCDSEDEKVKNILKDLTTAAEKVIPETKTEKYTKSPSEKSYQEWMFKDVTDSFGSPVGINAVKDFSEEKDGKTTYKVYMIEDPMKLDTSTLVDGGYLLFEGEGHAEKAQEFLNSIKDLTGDELAEKFSEESSSAVVSETISKTSIDFGALADWLFASDRAANDKSGVIAIEDTKPSDSAKNDKGSCVAFYRGSELAWKSNANSGYTTKTMQDWVQGLISSYELSGMSRIKDKAKTTASTTEGATTATKEVATA